MNKRQVIILWIIAIYAILVGVLRVLLALKLRTFANSVAGR